MFYIYLYFATHKFELLFLLFGELMNSTLRLYTLNLFALLIWRNYYNENSYFLLSKFSIYKFYDKHIYISS